MYIHTYTYVYIYIYIYIYIEREIVRTILTTQNIALTPRKNNFRIP